MRALYRNHFQDRYRALIGHVTEGCGSLVEVCMGDAYLYRHYLRKYDIQYLGCDINSVFVEYAKKQGLAAEHLDLWEKEVPQADVVLMQASLYQFYPDHDVIIRKMLAAASKKVVIAEPVNNITASNNRLIGKLGAWLSDAGSGNASMRFSKEHFESVMRAYGENLVFLQDIPGGREVVAVIDASDW